MLGFDRFLAGLEAGVAAHHAGMVPPFKEAVEACFTEGLTKAVFATETLALGVNMPARSVVIERLTKFTGERHELLTPGRVHAAHRAGRAAGHRRGRLRHRAVVAVRALRAGGRRWPSSRTFALRSAFRPTYNMAANLVRRYEPDQAHHLLNLSFAQYQADRAVVRLEARHRAPAGSGWRGCEAEARCERGDVEEYRQPARRGQRAPTPARGAGGRATSTAPTPPSAA